MPRSLTKPPNPQPKPQSYIPTSSSMSIHITTPSPSSNTTTDAKCFFLDSLPPELRIYVYSYLVLATSPLQGQTARQQPTGLNLSILRTNRCIYEEAKAVFLAKNVFYISSLVAARDANEVLGAEEGERLFEPSFTQHELKAVRHLEIDPVYRSEDVGEEMVCVEYWRPADLGAAEYSKFIPLSVPSRTTRVNHSTLNKHTTNLPPPKVKSLTHLLQTTTLRTLRLTATPPPHLTTKQTLTSFFTANRSPSFAAALASHGPAIAKIPIAFEFQDCYYRISVEPDALMHRSIMFLGCQVMFSRSQIRIQRMMREFGDEEEWGVGERVDLGPLVKEWPEKLEWERDPVAKGKEGVGW